MTAALLMSPPRVMVKLIMRELLSTGPQTLLVMDYMQDGKLQERMIPFVSAFVDDVDLNAKRIRVDWQLDY